MLYFPAGKYTIAGLVVEDWHNLGPHLLQLLEARSIAAVSSLTPFPSGLSAGVPPRLTKLDADLWPQCPLRCEILGMWNSCEKLPIFGA